MKRFYIDTSAYVAILLGHKRSADLEHELALGAWLSSTIIILETQRTLVRMAREKYLSAKELEQAIRRVESDLAYFSLRDLTPDLCLERSMPAVSTPRSLDLVHLRTARWFHGQAPLTRFVTLDEKLALAASELELPT